MSNGNSDKISRDYLDSLLIETRYLNSVIPSTEFTLFGEKFASPIMSAALSYVDHFMYEGAKNALVKGVVDANAVFWYGAAPDEDIEGFVNDLVKDIDVDKVLAIIGNPAIFLGGDSQTIGAQSELIGGNGTEIEVKHFVCHFIILLCFVSIFEIFSFSGYGFCIFWSIVTKIGGINKKLSKRSIFNNILFC